MSEEIRGKVFVAGDDVNTDEIIPARYCATTDVASLGQYALEDLHLSKSPGGVPFQPGEYDIIVAGENFGCGSSREVAPVALIHAGVKVIIADKECGITRTRRKRREERTITRQTGYLPNLSGGGTFREYDGT